MTTDVIIRSEGAVGRLSLNRPAALNALTGDMVVAMRQALLSWRDDSNVRAVVIDHLEGRGFCAGGDIRALAERGSAFARPFFSSEYQLNNLLFLYAKPVIAVLDGIVMGGGAGIGLPVPIRIGTERTVFAMPETGIGLIPDVGGGWHLPRLPGKAGIWLALTGARLRVADCLSLGIVTHVVESRRLPEIKAALVDSPEDAERILGLESLDPGVPTLDRARIDALFDYDSVEAILSTIDREGSDWARTQAAILRTRAPLSMKATLRHLCEGGAASSFAQVLAMEYRLCTRLVDTHDFKEGVRAVVVDRDNAPAWAPATLKGVDQETLDALFAPYPIGEEWRPLDAR